MPSVMSTGLSGLMAFQRAIDTTSHNIANANSPGYTRQSVQLGARDPSPASSGWIGNGVDVKTIQRNYDDFLSTTARSADTSATQLDVFAAQAERLNNMFGNSDTGIAAQFQKFQNALQGVAAAPTSQAARQVLLGEGRATVSSLQSYDGQLRASEESVNSQIRSDITEVNTIASGIARLNHAIALGRADTGQPPNDLMDQRDALLNRLAQKLTISVEPQGNGSVNVFVGNGQSLVLDEKAKTLNLGQDSFDATRPVITVGTGVTAVDITSSISGGSIGGSLDFRRQMLDPARNELGRIASAFVDIVNTQHRKGMDLNGALGGDMFAVGGAKVISSGTNTGTATVAALRSNVGAIQDYDIVLQKSAGGWTAARADTGANIAMTGTGTALDPFVFGGMTATVSGAVANGDQFLVRPTREAVVGMSFGLTSPSTIAVAAPIRASAAAANKGTATTTLGEVLDPSNAALRQPVTLQFLTPTTYSVNGSGSFNYTSGQPIDINGWRIAISGAPVAGDQFSVQDNSSGIGDNRNAMALGDALNKPVLDGGTASLTQGVAGFVGQIGQATNEATMNRDAQAAIRDEAVKSRDNVQGVNLDEEAANLLRYQQAYQAMAQIIKVATAMFDALINAAR